MVSVMREVPLAIVIKAINIDRLNTSFAEQSTCPSQYIEFLTFHVDFHEVHEVDARLGQDSVKPSYAYRNMLPTFAVFPLNHRGIFVAGGFRRQVKREFALVVGKADRVDDDALQARRGDGVREFRPQARVGFESDDAPGTADERPRQKAEITDVRADVHERHAGFERPPDPAGFHAFETTDVNAALDEVGEIQIHSCFEDAGRSNAGPGQERVDQAALSLDGQRANHVHQSVECVHASHEKASGAFGKVSGRPIITHGGRSVQQSVAADAHLRPRGRRVVRDDRRTDIEAGTRRGVETLTQVVCLHRIAAERLRIDRRVVRCEKHSS